MRSHYNDNVYVDGNRLAVLSAAVVTILLFCIQFRPNMYVYVCIYVMHIMEALTFPSGLMLCGRFNMGNV